jgi:hypothetical protein
VSPELRPLLEAVYGEIARRPSDLAGLKSALEHLLEFPCSTEGGTNANCWAADLFFCLGEGWEVDWEHLPDEFGDILGDMGGALRDTVQSPEVATNFDSTPERLVERLRAIDISNRVA